MLPRVGVGRVSTAVWCPGLASPVSDLHVRIEFHTLPVNSSVRGFRDVREHRVFKNCVHSIRIGAVRSA
jgi:hypothetical protein